MCIAAVMNFSVDALIGFTVKNTYCYYGLDKVRTQLQDLITRVALPKLGSFAAPIVGNQLGLIFALPVTLFYGEMTALAVKRLVRTIRTFVSELFHGAQYGPERKPMPLFRNVVMHVVSFAAGFFAKTYFCNYAMPYVSLVLRHVIVLASPFFGISFGVALLAPAFVVVMSPATTFFLGDVVGAATGFATYKLLHHTFRLLADTEFSFPNAFLQI